MPDENHEPEFWELRSDAWARHADAMEGFASQFGQPALELLGPAPGQHLADVGCGPGLTTIELGERVGSDGTATGVDVAEGMIEAARARASAAGASNVHFSVGDPGTGPLGSFDAIFSRFGIMFFDHPETALSNLARSIRPGGRFVATVWAELDANPWMFVPTLFGAGPLNADVALPGRDEPGPFRMADPQRTASMLRDAGFVDVDITRHEHEWSIERSNAGASFAELLAVGPLGAAWARADERTRTASINAVRDGCADFQHGNSFRLPAAAYVVAATVPWSGS